MESQGEIWKAHPEYTEIEVSTLGRVRTLDRVISNGKGTRLVKGQVLKPFGSGIGYLQVSIQIDGKRTNKYVHRLVAQTFLSNPNGFPMVNHLDCDITNNKVENLEWCTASYNSKYREKFGKASGHPVFAINLTTLEVLYFRSQREASRELGVSHGNIYSVLKGRIKQTGGYHFENANAE